MGKKVTKYRFNELVISILLFLSLNACINSNLDGELVLEESECQNQWKKHTIDQFLDDCLSNSMNYTTVGMTQCTAEAYEKWKSEMDRLIQGLQEALPQHIQSSFEDSQSMWETYFQAQTEFSNLLFSQSNGSMYATIRVNNNLTVLKERVLLLDVFLKEAQMLSELDSEF
jgi:hypothetical protein